MTVEEQMDDAPLFGYSIRWALFHNMWPRSIFVEMSRKESSVRSIDGMNQKTESETLANH